MKAEELTDSELEQKRLFMEEEKRLVQQYCSMPEDQRQVLEDESREMLKEMGITL